MEEIKVTVTQEQKEEICDQFCEVKKWWAKSKVLWVNFSTFVLSLIPDILQAFMENSQAIKEYKMEYYFALLVVNALANAWMRFKTSEPIGKKPDDEQPRS